MVLNVFFYASLRKEQENWTIQEVVQWQLTTVKAGTLR